jgi:hypothetical protein
MMVETMRGAAHMVHSFGKVFERERSTLRAAIGVDASLVAPAGLRELPGKIREGTAACRWRFVNQGWRFAK